MTATKAQLLSLLERERDRLALEADGFALALEASCDTGAIALVLLVPVAAVAARLACALGDLAEVRTRVDVLEGIIAQVEQLAGVVSDADEHGPKWPALEDTVLHVVAAVHDVSVRSDLFNEFAQTARETLASILPTVGKVLIGAAVALGLYFVATRRR